MLQLRRESWVVAIIIGCFAAIRVPFLSHYLVNWDAVQYALGSQDFDLHRHQPHPPGYIGYVALARLLNTLTGDANQSLVLISVAGGALAPAGLYLLARSFMPMPRRYALLTAVLFGTSPLLWYYSSVALNYAPGAALAIWIAWACHQARTRGAARYLLLGALLLAALGALRQTDLLFLLPLWLWSAWRFPMATRVRAAATLVAAMLAWLAPLLWLAGGPLAYLRESIELFQLVGGNTSVFSNPVRGLPRNLVMVLVGILGGAHLGLIAIGIAVRRAGSLSLGIPRRQRGFVLLWGGPALAVYVLGHMGQFGYVLLVLPIVFLWVGIALARLGESLTDPSARGTAQPWEGYWFAAATSLVLVINLVGFLLLPSTLYRWASDGGRNANSSLARELLQYDLRASDRHWRDTIDIVRHHDPATTAVLTTTGGPRLSGGFRILSYYLPDYRVYGFDEDRSDTFGYLFTAFAGRSNYSVDGLRTAGDRLPLDASVRLLIIPDAELADRFDVRLTRTVHYLPDGTRVVVAVLPRGMALTISPTGQIVSAQPALRATLYDE